MLQPLSLGLVSLAYAAWMCREFYRSNSLKKGRFKTFVYICIGVELGKRFKNNEWLLLNR